MILSPKSERGRGTDVGDTRLKLTSPEHQSIQQFVVMKGMPVVAKTTKAKTTMIKAVGLPRYENTKRCAVMGMSA